MHLTPQPKAWHARSWARFRKKIQSDHRCRNKFAPKPSKPFWLPMGRSTASDGYNRRIWPRLHGSLREGVYFAEVHNDVFRHVLHSSLVECTKVLLGSPRHSECRRLRMQQ